MTVFSRMRPKNFAAETAKEAERCLRASEFLRTAKVMIELRQCLNIAECFADDTPRPLNDGDGLAEPDTCGQRPAPWERCRTEKFRCATKGRAPTSLLRSKLLDEIWPPLMLIAPGHSLKAHLGSAPRWAFCVPPPGGHRTATANDITPAVDPTFNACLGRKRDVDGSWVGVGLPSFHSVAGRGRGEAYERRHHRRVLGIPDSWDCFCPRAGQQRHRLPHATVAKAFATCEGDPPARARGHHAVTLIEPLDRVDHPSSSSAG